MPVFESTYLSLLRRDGGCPPHHTGCARREILKYRGRFSGGLKQNTCRAGICYFSVSIAPKPNSEGQVGGGGAGHLEPIVQRAAVFEVSTDASISRSSALSERSPIYI